MILRNVLSLSMMLICSLQVIHGQENMVQTLPGTEVSFSMQFVKGNDSIPDFYMGSHEVPHDLYVLFKRKEFDNAESDLMDDYSPDAISRPSPPYEDMTWGMGEEGGFPMVSMTQQGAIRFCEWLYMKTGVFYRLPTPEEWTYVAAQLPNKDGWFEENSENKFHKTGLVSNGNGFYDMFGNVTEWTMDRKVLKGGSFIDSAEEINAESVIKYNKAWQQRDPQIPKSVWWLTDGSFVGFRVVSPVKTPSKDEIEAFFAEYIK